MSDFKLIATGSIRESSANPRQHFDDQAMAELEESIRARGILSPLLVRESTREVETTDGPTYEVIAGHRRLRAAAALGLAEVPALILDTTAFQAREDAIIENLQREQMRALEEARAFGAIAGHPARLDDVRELACRIGKPGTYVWDRIKLLDLIPDAQQLLERGRLPTEIAQLLARQTPELQTAAIDPMQGGVFEPESGRLFEPGAHLGEQRENDSEDADAERDPWANVKARTLREVRAWVATHVRFNPMRAAIVAPLEFQPVADRVEQAHMEPGRGLKVVHITHDYHVHPEAKGEERTYCHGSWRPADPEQGGQPCDRTVLGVIVTGPGYGQAFPVCIHKDCPVHWADEIRRKEKEFKARQASPGKAAQSDAAARKHQEEDRAKEEAAREAYRKAIPALKAATVAAVKTAKPLSLAPLIMHPVNPSIRKAFGTAKTVDDLVRLCALQAIWWALTNEWSGAHVFAPFAKQLGIDLPAMLKAQDNPAAGKPAPAAKKAGKGSKRG